MQKWIQELFPRRPLRRSLPKSDIAIEGLEQRIVPADLTGFVYASPDVIQPGQSVNVNWQVTNFDPDQIWWTGFYVDFWISRDTSVSFDDRYLGSRFLPAGFPGYYSTLLQPDSLSLPNATDSFWLGGSAFNIIMIVDSYNYVVESAEWNNIISTTVSTGSNSGGGGGQTITDLNSLPDTGFARGTVLKGVISVLQSRLSEAASSQSKMGSQLSKIAPVPTSATELKSLSSSIKSIGSSLNNLLNGKATSVTLAPGVVLDQAGLDQIERYLKYVFDNGSVPASARYAPAATGVFDPKKLIPGYETYQQAKKWLSDTEAKIQGAVDAVKNAPNKAVQWISSLFGKSGVEQSKAQTEAKVVDEGGHSLADRVNELEQQMAPQSIEDQVAVLDSFLTGTPQLFAIASGRIKAVMRKNGQSISRLEDQVINLETWGRNQSFLGTWQGTYDWESQGYVLQGAIALVVKPASAANKLTVTLANDFRYNGKIVGKTRGTATGSMGADGVFRGQLSWTSGKTKGSGPVEWRINGNKISGNVFEDPNVALRVPFAATKISSR